MTSAPEAELPLRPIDFHILLVLADGDLHGYGIVKEIESRDARVRLEPGNLYRYLRRLVDRGMVRPVERRPVDEGDDERRRYYSITGHGRRVLRAEVARMNALVRAAEARGLAT